MPYCSRCGIEVEDHVLKCPLCNLKIQHFDKPPETLKNFPDDNYRSNDYYIPFESQL